MNLNPEMFIPAVKIQFWRSHWKDRSEVYISVFDKFNDFHWWFLMTYLTLSAVIWGPSLFWSNSSSFDLSSSKQLVNIFLPFLDLFREIVCQVFRFVLYYTALKFLSFLYLCLFDLFVQITLLFEIFHIFLDMPQFSVIVHFPFQSIAEFVE